jgi:hypothetical protein
MTTRRLLILAAALLLGVLFFLDLNTGRELIPAIAYTVPVALSSLAHAPRWTGALVALSLLATAGAGVQNTLDEGLSSAALLNRLLAALSVALVGTFALLLERKGARVTQLEREEGRAEREADLRHLLTDLSHEHTPHTLLSRAATSLQPLFGAAKVVISATERGRLSAPHYSSAPGSAGELCEGRLTPWVAALPAAGTQVASARLDGKLLTAGWLRRPGKAALLVLVASPKAEEPCALLSDVLAGLEPLLEHAEGLEDRAWSPQAVLN